MALSDQRYREIDAELQQVRDRFTRLSSELASATAYGSDFAFVSKISAYVSDHVEQMRRLLAIA
jgi:hypothetical protein